MSVPFRSDKGNFGCTSDNDHNDFRLKKSCLAFLPLLPISTVVHKNENAAAAATTTYYNDPFQKGFRFEAVIKVTQIKDIHSMTGALAKVVAFHHDICDLDICGFDVNNTSKVS